VLSTGHPSQFSHGAVLLSKKSCSIYLRQFKAINVSNCKQLRLLILTMATPKTHGAGAICSLLKHMFHPFAEPCQGEMLAFQKNSMPDANDPRKLSTLTEHVPHLL